MLSPPVSERIDRPDCGIVRGRRSGAGQLLLLGVVRRLHRIRDRVSAGDTATSTATLVRIDGEQLVIRFSPPIPLPIIIEQQRLLIIQVPQG